MFGNTTDNLKRTSAAHAPERLVSSAYQQNLRALGFNGRIRQVSAIIIPSTHGCFFHPDVLMMQIVSNKPGDLWCITKKRINLTDQVKGFIVTGGDQRPLERLNCAGGDLQSWLRVRGERR